MEKIKLLECIQEINHQIVRYVEQTIRQRTDFDIKYSHYEIIRLLLTKKTMSMKDLSQKVMKHKSTVTALVKKLHDYELLEYHKDRRDDRKQLVSITAEGKALRGVINAIEQKIMIIVHRELTVQEQNEALLYLNKMQQSLHVQHT